MELDIRIEATNTVEVPEDIAAVLREVYEKLSELPSARVATVDFKPEDYQRQPNGQLRSREDAGKEAVRAARLFVRQAKTWAEDNGLKFARKGDVKGNPARVSFRVYEPRTGEDTTEVGEAGEDE